MTSAGPSDAEAKHDVSELAGNEGGAHVLSDYEDDDQGQRDESTLIVSSDDDDIGTGNSDDDDGIGRQSDLSPLREAEHDIQKHVRV